MPLNTQLPQPKRLKDAEGLPPSLRAEIGRQRRDQRDDGGCDPALRLDLSERRVLRARGHAAARIHWNVNLISSRDRVTSSVQHHHLGREPGDDQVLPAGCKNRGARRLVQEGAG